jgi:hypothetical protein
VAHVPVLNAWGERDSLIIQDLAEKPVANFAESNRRFQREIRGMGLPITNLEVPGGVHSQLAPPGAAIVEIVTGRRRVDPNRIDQELFPAELNQVQPRASLLASTVNVPQSIAIASTGPSKAMNSRHGSALVREPAAPGRRRSGRP